MFNWLRTLVAGAKHRLIQGQYNLDLTYITQRIIAMAFPASGCEQLYRNRIDDVSSYLQSKHKDKYYVINVSNRNYDQSYFNGRVKSYQWNDHQAPRLYVLYQICKFMYNYLQQNSENVVIVHCNHGKGRTGTAIMAYLLSISDYQVSEVLKYYNKKRFLKESYVVDQPCQIRYLNFFKEIVNNPSKESYRKQKAFQLKQLKSFGLDLQSYYIKITSVRTGQTLLNKTLLSKQPYNNQHSQPLIGDIFIQIIKKGYIFNHRISRINYNVSFLNNTQDNNNNHFIELKGQNIVIEKCHHRNFTIFLIFEQLLNHQHVKNDAFKQSLQLQEEQWQTMLSWFRKTRKKMTIVKEGNQNINGNMSKSDKYLEQQK